MIDRRPLDRRPEDRADRPLSLVPAPEDPQEALVRLQDVLREIDEARAELQALLTRWGNDPVGTMHRAQARVLELQQLVSQTAPLGESLSMAMRANGHLSYAWRS